MSNTRKSMRKAEVAVRTVAETVYNRISDIDVNLSKWLSDALAHQGKGSSVHPNKLFPVAMQVANNTITDRDGTLVNAVDARLTVEFNKNSFPHYNKLYADVVKALGATEVALYPSYGFDDRSYVKVGNNCHKLNGNNAHHLLRTFEKQFVGLVPVLQRMQDGLPTCLYTLVTQTELVVTPTVIRVAYYIMFGVPAKGCVAK